MSYSARYVKPEELRGIWAQIRPGLLEVKEASDDAWIPEDVYADCYSKHSMLWVLEDDSRVIGFAVIQPQGETLHIWCGWGAMLLEEGFARVFDIAKRGGARKISFESTRPGWQRVAKRFGFRPRKWVAEV